MSLGWRAQPSALPRRPRGIDEVGQATMVDLKAELYKAGSADAAERPKKRARADPLSLRNAGVAARDAADLAHEREEEARRDDALKRKAAQYDALQRGDAAAAGDSLVDFELKQLTAPDADDRERQRSAWEASARRDAAEAEASADGRGFQHASAAEKRELAGVASETSAARSSASEAKQKRQRALDERRAMLRLRSEAKERAAAEEAARNEWEEHVDAKTGCAYFHCRATGETLWERPP